MLLWLQFFLISAGFTARLFIPASTAGSGLNLVVYLFIWLAFLIYLVRPAQTHSPSLLKIRLALFAAFIVISFIHAPYKFGAFPYLVSWISDIVLFYLVWQLCSQNPALLKPFIWLFISNAVVITLVALHQHFWGLAQMVAEINQNPQLLGSIPEALRPEFMGRAKAAEPFATLTYQNSLAAFLVLAIPVVIVSMFCHCSEKESGAKFRTITSNPAHKYVLGGLLIFLTVLTLVLTGSKGGIVAFVAAMLVLIIAWGWDKLSSPIKKILIFAGIICLVTAAVISTAAILTPETPQAIKDVSHSMEVRFEYWRATAKIIGNNFWSGVGLNQFGAAYLQYKSVSAGETIKAHNDYLQIASEMGIPALLIFILIWLIILRSHPRKSINTNDTNTTNDTNNSCASSSNSWYSCFILGALFAFLLTELFQLPLIPTDIPFLSTIILITVWLLIFTVLSKYFDSNSKLVRIGLFAGIIGFLIHSTVDFNFYVPGLSMSIWFVGALLLASSPGSSAQERGWISSKAIRFFLILLVAGIVIAFCILIPRLMNYESELEIGKSLAHSKDKAEIRSSREYFLNANNLNPYAVDSLLALAWDTHNYFCPPEKYQLPEWYGSMGCLDSMDKAIRLSPTSPMLYYQYGILCRQHIIWLQKTFEDFDPGPVTKAAVNSRIRIYEEKSDWVLKKLKELYPTFKNSKHE